MEHEKLDAGKAPKAWKIPWIGVEDNLAHGGRRGCTRDTEYHRCTWPNGEMGRGIESRAPRCAS